MKSNIHEKMLKLVLVSSILFSIACSQQNFDEPSSTNAKMSTPSSPVPSDSSKEPGQTPGPVITDQFFVQIDRASENGGFTIIVESKADAAYVHVSSARLDSVCYFAAKSNESAVVEQTHKLSSLFLHETIAFDNGTSILFGADPEKITNPVFKMSKENQGKLYEAVKNLLMALDSEQECKSVYGLL